MRPLRYSINVTLDGCCHHEAGLPPDEESMRYWTAAMAGAGALLLGRVTYEMMQSAWRKPATGSWPEWMVERDIPFAEAIHRAEKHVVSSTLDEVDWNAQLVRGDLRALAEALQEGAVESVVEDLGRNRGVVCVRDVRPAAPAPRLDSATTVLARRYARWMVTGDDVPADPHAASAPIPEQVLADAATTRAVDVLLPVPDVPRLLLLSFSTPVVPLFGPLTTLFLTIASTVQWNRDGELWS